MSLVFPSLERGIAERKERAEPPSKCFFMYRVHCRTIIRRGENNPRDIRCTTAGSTDVESRGFTLKAWVGGNKKALEKGFNKLLSRGLPPSLHHVEMIYLTRPFKGKLSIFLAISSSSLFSQRVIGADS